MEKIYQVKRSESYTMLACALFFTTFAVVATVGGVVDNQRLPFYLIPAFFAGLSALALTAYVDYVRHELRLAPDQLTKRGLRSTVTLPLSEIASCRWSRRRTVRLDSSAGKIFIELRLYADDDKLEIIRYLRANVAESMQHNWPEFCHHVALRLRESLSDRAPGQGEIRITRERYDRWGLALFIACIPAGIAGWWITGNLAYLAAPTVSVPFWLLLRYSTPQKGYISERMLGTWRSIRYLSALALLAAIAICWFAIRGTRGPIESPDAIFLVLFLTMLFANAYIEDRRNRRQAEIDAPNSVARWAADEIVSE